MVSFKTFESKFHKNLYFAGEILNIDAVTGGFNFQNAWSGAYIASKAMIEAIDLLDVGNTEFISNDDSKATYNTTPTLNEAFLYRKKRIFG